MEPIAVAALSVTFEAIFRKLSSQDVLKYASGNKVGSEVNRWENELRKIKRVLDDAEERQMGEVLIKNWLDELRDLAYDVEDILDEFSTQVMREKVTAETEASPSKVRQLIPTCCSSIKFNMSLGSKMEEITQRLEAISKEKENLNLTERAPGVVTERLETTNLVQESQVYGREKDKETLVNELLRSGNPVSVVAIVGMGGLGKTTLAQLLYNDQTVSGSFDIKAWVCVSDEFDVFKIAVKIIEGFTKRPCNMGDLNMFEQELRCALRGKKFLLVLDDVWSENYLEWDALIRPLAEGGLGGRVLITTRNENVEAIAGSVIAYRLKKLNPEECSSLLARHALGGNDFSGHPMLKEIGEEIAMKCDGLPLAAKAIGGLLRVKRNHTGWSEILKSNMWELPLDQCPIMPALRVSYHHLPSPLKRCFAYCAIFPKDYAFDKDDLILWWNAEGFLEQSTDFMKLGNDYFQDLLSRSFFQPSTYAEFDSKLDSKFVMHDLMNDLAMWISGRICLHLPHDKEIASGLKFENLRHLSFMSHDNEDAQRFEKVSSSTRLRTFIAFTTLFNNFCMKSNDIFGNMIVNMRCLKVLCLSGYDIKELPDSISKLKLLRHLDMSYTNIRLLPESVSELLNLQILKLNYCLCLIQLPREIRKLINLQLLDISVTPYLKGMPSGIDRLTKLQILPEFIVGENHVSRLKELKRLSLIQGKLCISRLEHVVDIQDAKDADLKAKVGLVSLKFQWSADSIDLEEEKQAQILAELQPHTSLKSLEIRGYNGKHLPRWVGDSKFTNLETLTLCYCNSASSLLPFGGLSSLKTLHIRWSNMTNLPNQLLCLGELSIEGCSNLKTLPNQLPSLRELRIGGCSNLTNLPNELPSLETLMVERCLNLTNLSDQLPLLTRLGIEGFSRLTNLPDQLPSLIELTIEDGSNLTNLPNELPLLTRLSICLCSNLTNLPNQLHLLTRLSIYEGSNLTNLPNQLPLLTRLSIERCSNLTNLPNQLPSLETLTIEECSNLTNFPNELSLLTRLSIKRCSNLKNLSNQLPSLVELTIENCSNLTNLPNKLPSLIDLTIENCSDLTNLPNQLLFLTRLSIEGCSNLINLPNQLPSLGYLRIEECSNLTNLPDQLPLLRFLTIEGCSKLTNLPDQLPSLRLLTIEGCSKLTNLSN